MPSPLDAITRQFGLPDGFLDALYPFSLYQTIPPIVDRTPPQMGPPNITPQPQTGPNPLGQQIPPGPVDAFMRQPPPMMGVGGMNPFAMMGGMGPMPPMPFPMPSTGRR
jgi:hypothetical protein